ncbi:MAG: DUF996 domain-containing protein, partial [Candidatus Omnitrophica bacterium]|nr:DUF996 domain-containing protein [Candidatus Omnitrophota bacterium]
MDIKQIKYLGGIGATLVFFTIIPFVGFVANITGIVLMAIAFYQLANIINNKAIFNKFLIGLVLRMVGLIIAIYVGLIFGLSYFFITNIPLTSVLSNINGAFLGIGVAILVWWILEIISANFYAKSYKLVGDYFNRYLFNLTANFLFWGAVTAIVLVGFILIFISNI